MTELARIKGMEGWLPFQAALAALSAQADYRQQAADAYAAALDLNPAPAERLYLEARRRAVQ